MLTRRYVIADWSVARWTIVLLAVATVLELAQFVVELPPLKIVDVVDIPWAFPFALVAIVLEIRPIASVTYRMNRAYVIAFAILIALSAGVAISFAIAS